MRNWNPRMIDPHMRCIEPLELVTEWMEDALDDVTLSRLEEHLVICPACGDMSTQIRQARARGHARPRRRRASTGGAQRATPAVPRPASALSLRYQVRPRRAAIQSHWPCRSAAKPSAKAASSFRVACDGAGGRPSGHEGSHGDVVTRRPNAAASKARPAAMPPAVLSPSDSISSPRQSADLADRLGSSELLDHVASPASLSTTTAWSRLRHTHQPDSFTRNPG